MIKVGIIDDEILARKVLEEYCSKIDNFELVLSTGNPIEFVNFIQQHEVDLIFLDIEMPDMNGFEFAEKVKSDSKWQDTPMVALSSHATPQDIDRGLEVGFNKYIAKFDRETLLHTISETLAERMGG